MENERIDIPENSENGDNSTVESSEIISAEKSAETLETAKAPDSEPTTIDEAKSADSDTLAASPDVTEADEAKNPSKEEAEPPKRKRGRPRKNPLPPPVPEIDDAQFTMEIPDIAPSFDEVEISNQEINEELSEKDLAEITDKKNDEATLDAETDGTSEYEVSEAKEAQDQEEHLASEEENEEFIIPAIDSDELFISFDTPCDSEEELAPDGTDTVLNEPNGQEPEEPKEEPKEESKEEPNETEKPKKREAPKLPKKEREIGSRWVDTTFDFLELFIFTFVGVLLVTTFIFRHSVVSGNSMLNTLHDGDKLIISDLFYTPDYGDIVVVEDHTAGIMSPIVKRVIALEGDTVRVTEGGIFINGILENSVSYVYTDGTAYFYDIDDYRYFTDYEGFDFRADEYYEFIVPEDEVYVLGDHRNDSTDSRKRGTVREDAILGRVIVRFYPFEDFKFFN